MIRRNKFEMAAHEMSLKPAYKHRPDFDNKWPDGVND